MRVFILWLCLCAMTLAEARVVGVLALALLIPGWTLLTLTQTWRVWRGLERWVVAVGLISTTLASLAILPAAIMPPEVMGPTRATNSPC